MPRRTIYFELTDTADERCDRAIEALLICLLLFAPLALGTVQAWSEWVVILLATAMAGCLAIKLLTRPDVPFIRSWTYLPIFVVLGLGLFQIVPLPASVLRAISPQTFEMRRSLLEIAGLTADRMTLSFYPEATLQNLRMLVAIATVYVVTINTIRRIEQVRRMLAAMTLIGLLVALIALVHLALGATRIYGFIGPEMHPWLTGPFINRNHFGQFVNLGLGAGVGLLLMQIDDLQSRSRRRVGREDLPASVWALGGAVAVMAIAVCLSLSRGAILSLVIAGGVASIVSARRGRSARLWVLVPIAWLVALAVLWFGFDPLLGRFVQMIEPESASVGGRLTIIRDALDASRNAPIFGHGLGSFETVYPMFDSSQSATLAVHAENEYVQALFEGGAIEASMLLLFLCMAAVSYVRCIRTIPSPMGMPAVGLGMGIMAVVLQSASDFGQHLPANAMMTAVAIAMLVNLGAASRKTEADATDVPVRKGLPGTRAVGAMAAGAVLAMVIYDGFGALRAEQHWMTVRGVEPLIRDRQWEGSEEAFSRLLVAADRASRIRPGDIHYRYWLNFYRMRYISQERDQQTGQVVYDEQRLDWARRIVSDLLAAIRICPTYGPAYSLAGQIGKNVTNRDGSDRLIRQGFALSRTDPAAAFEAAILDAEAGNWDPAMQKLEHAASLLAAYRAEGAATLAGPLRRTDLAMALAGEDLFAIRRVIATLRQAGDTAAADEAEKKMAMLIYQRGDDPAADPAALVEAARLSMAARNFEAAVRYYDRALRLDASRSEWRLQMARALAAQGNAPRALIEARTARRMDAPGAEALVLELSTRPAIPRASAASNAADPGVAPATTNPATAPAID